MNGRDYPLVVLGARKPNAPALPALDGVATKLARGLADALAQFGWLAGGASGCEGLTTGDAWRSGVPRAVIAFALPELGTTMLLALPLQFHCALVDRFYGGEGASEAGRTSLSRGELRVLQTLGERLVPLVAAAWGTLTPVTPQLGPVGTLADTALPAGSLAVLDLTLTDRAGGETVASVVLPEAALLPLATANDAPAANPFWHEQLKEAVMAARLPVRSVVDRPELPVERLLRLRPGDVLPLRLPPLVPLTAAGRLLGWGRIGEANGRTAIELETVELHS